MVKSSLSDLLAEWDEAENQRLIEALRKSNADLQFPVVVRFGDRIKQEFSIHRRLSIGEDSITYEAFRKAGEFVTTIPVVIKAYRHRIRKHPDFLKKDEKRVTFDRHHLLVAFNNEFSKIDSSKGQYSFEVNEQLLDALNDPHWNELPYVIFVGPNKDDNYMVEKYVGRGVQGVVYEGYRTSDPLKKPLIIKSYLRNEKNVDVFRNEEFALEQQSRLIHSDPNHMIIVQIKIQGDTLGKLISSLILKNNITECESLLDRYSAVPRNFRDKFGLVHNDAHPDNIIVDTNNVLQLIDFGKTEILSDDERESAIQEYKDDKIVNVWTEIYKSILISRGH